MKARTVVVALALLAGCQGPGSAGPARAGGTDLAITAEIDYAADASEGALATFDVRIKNASQKYVILRDLVEPGVGTVATWQISMPGTLDYNPRTGDFEYDATKPSPTPRPAVNVAMLLPGEEILFRPTIRLLRMPRSYLLNYFALEKTDLSSNVYFETRADRRIRYRRHFGGDLDKALAPSLKQNAASHRTVVYPHAETILDTPRQEPVILRARVQPRALTIDQAAAKAGSTRADVGANYTYCSQWDGWLMRTPRGSFLVTPRGAEPLPEISNLDAFSYLIDTAGDATLTFRIRTPLEVRLTPHGFRMLATGEGSYKYSALVARADVRRLMRLLADEKLRIDLVADRGTFTPIIRR